MNIIKLGVCVVFILKCSAHINYPISKDFLEKRLEVIKNTRLKHQNQNYSKISNRYVFNHPEEVLKLSSNEINERVQNHHEHGIFDRKPYNIQSQKVISNKTPCNESFFRYSDQKIPRTIITSFPGSGNTWFRHLIHMSTGFYTGSVYHDSKLQGQGFKGEMLDWSDNRTVGIKMHQLGMANKLSSKLGLLPHQVFPKTLLLIRNPLRAILSEFNRVKSRSHTGTADEKLFEDGTFLEFLEKNLPRWGRSITKWMNEYKGQVHTVCYEKMKEETVDVVKSAVEFMEVPFARPKCIKRSRTSQGSFNRKKSTIVDVTQMLENKPQIKKVADLVLEGVSNTLRRFNLEDCTEYF